MSAARAFPGLVFRQDFFADPAGWQAIGDLLKTVFELDVSPIDRFGGHDRSNLPSAYFGGDGRCVANLTAFSMPLIVDGRPVRAAAWQSGAVLPEYRGRGLFRELIRIALARCEAAGFEALALYTDSPTLYEPYGFIALEEQRFVGPPPPVDPKAPRSLSLSIDRPEDIALMQRMLASRAPVSTRFAVSDQSLMFLFNAWLLEDVSLALLKDVEAIVAWRQSPDGVFELLDIVASAIPPLSSILTGLNATPERISVEFPPDRLGWEGVPIATNRDLVFMIRAPQHLLPSGAFRLSPMADF